MRALPRLEATRYVQPLREGGSLPAVVDTDGGGLYAVKFRGAGQGARALIAEVVVGALAEALGFLVPPLAVVEVGPHFGRSEPDPEIQELLQRSHGANVGLRYLDGAFNFDPSGAGDLVDATFASRLVWLDALTTNPDRTHRNPNLMVWDERVWLIDHGSALYAHHDWASVDDARTRTRFPRIADHVLLAEATALRDADRELAPLVSPELLGDVMRAVPDELFDDPSGPVGGGELATADAARERYASYLVTRVGSPREWLDEAVVLHERLAADPPKPFRARR